MKGSTIFWLSILIALVVLLVVFAIWVYRLQKPSPGKDCRKNSNWVWDKSCLYLEEKFYDSTLVSPKDLYPVLTNFTYARGGGNSIFLPMWYRFRYVNVLTGGYSDLSEWSRSPVISGSCCLPCPKGIGQCPSTIKTGWDSCPFNQPSIGISSKEAQYDPLQPQTDGSYIYINLHRYVGSSASDTKPPPDNAKDQIVGYFIPGRYIGGTQYYEWTDVLFNPCEKGCTTPTWCQGSKTTCTGSCPA